MAAAQKPRGPPRRDSGIRAPLTPSSVLRPAVLLVSPAAWSPVQGQNPLVSIPLPQPRVFLAEHLGPRGQPRQKASRCTNRAINRSPITALCRPFGQTCVWQGLGDPARKVTGFLRGLFRMCPVLTGRRCNPVDLGFTGALEPVWRAFPEGFGRRARIATLCNSLLPADSPGGRFHNKEAPSPARIQTNRPRQTGQDLNRLPKKAAQK